MRAILQKWKIPILLAIAAVLFFLTMPPVSAVEMRAMDIPSYSFDAPAGTAIYQILVDQLPMGANQSHTFKCGDATYFLKIETSNPYSIYYDFDISFTFPNGSTQKLHKSVTRMPGAGYKTNIQPVYTQAETLSFVVWTIDLEVGTSNQSVKADINTGPAGWSPSDAIPFTSAAGEFGNHKTNVFLYDMSISDFQNHVVKYDPVFGLSNLGSTVFQWTWETVLGFINQIPGIGPQLSTILELTAAIIAEIVFWLVWIVVNLPMILAAAEVTIFVCAFIFAEKNPKPETVLKNFFNYNKAAVLGFIWLFEKVYDWSIRFITMVATVIRALNPL